MTECFTSSKPTITRYNPSENYVVQLVESLASVDSPSENHIYVIEDTNEKYIYYNGAFSKLTASAVEPLYVSYSGSFTGNSNGIYTPMSCSNITFSKTYEEIQEAMANGIPVYLDSDYENEVDVNVTGSEIIFTWHNLVENADKHYLYIWDIRLPQNGNGYGNYIVLPMDNLVPDSYLSSTSSRAVQNKVVKQKYDYLANWIDSVNSKTLDTINYVANEDFTFSGDDTTLVRTVLNGAISVYKTVVDHQSGMLQYVTNAMNNQRPIVAYVDFSADRKHLLHLTNVTENYAMFSGFADYNDGMLFFMTELVIKENETYVLTYIN